MATFGRITSGSVVGVLALCALAGCSGTPSGTLTGVVTGTVTLSGNITPGLATSTTAVLAWQDHHQRGQAPVRPRRRSQPPPTAGHVFAVGTYRLTLAPGRYVLDIRTAPPAGDVSDHIVTVRAGVTVTKNLGFVFHAPATITETPMRPYGLAVSSSGVLYVVDVGRDQVLKYNPDGTFTVVAGTGQQGFSGDGGLATQAQLRLTNFSGLAVDKAGSLYIADSGNNRVRAVFPDGVINTAVGTGGMQSSLSPSAALLTDLGPVSGLTTFGRYDFLYIAAQDGVAQLSSKVQWVAGSLTPQVLPPCGVFCNPAGEADFVGVSSLAFDAAGDMFCSGGPGSYAVYEAASGGSLSYVGTFRGDGGPAALAETPDGNVIMSYRGGVVRLNADGTTTPVTSLDGVLGTGDGHPNVFIGGDGLAVGPDGSIYVDTDTGNTFTTVSAIIRVSANGASPTVLWES